MLYSGEIPYNGEQGLCESLVVRLHSEDKNQRDAERSVAGPQSPVEHTATAKNASTTPRAKKMTLEERRVGQILDGRYRLLELIGRGGMAAVYKAQHLGMPSPVAVKMLLPHIEEDELMVERFLREAKTSGRVAHPHVVQLMDYGEADGSRYIVVEYLDGASLSQILKEEGKLSVERTLHICAQVCEALEDSHRKKIIHRDLKPSNIMLIEHDGRKDFVKVVDFGLAKNNAGESQRLTQTGELFGSPIYMSPEQCRGFPLDGRSDIYSLGIIMYEAIAGKPPLVGENLVATITKHLHEAPMPFKLQCPDVYVPARLEAVIMKCLAKEPEQRYASMLEVREALIAAVPPPTAATGLRNLRANWTARIIDFLSERVALAIALSMVLMIVLVTASAFVTTMILKEKHEKGSPAGVQHHTPTNPQHIPRSADHAMQSSTHTIKSHADVKPDKHTSEAHPQQGRENSAPIPDPQKVDSSGEPQTSGETVTHAKKHSRQKRDTVDGVKVKANRKFEHANGVQYRPRHRRREESDRDVFYDYQLKERKYSRPRVWDPPISGSNQGR